MNDQYKNSVVEEPIEETIFRSYDFTNTVFTYRSLEKQINNAEFATCIFNKTTFGLDSFNGNIRYSTQRFWRSRFTDCKFTGVDMRSIFWGHGSVVQNCTFLRCDFRVGTFSNVDFLSCVFEKCKCRFDSGEALFEDCHFIGKLSDVTFNLCHNNKDLRPNTMKGVDFSRAILGDYVSFEGIDMNNCIPPNGQTWDDLLYQFEEANPKLLSTGNKEKTVISANASKWIEEKKQKRS